MGGSLPFDPEDLESFAVARCAHCRERVALAAGLVEVDGEVRLVSALLDVPDLDRLCVLAAFGLAPRSVAGATLHPCDSGRGPGGRQ